MRDRLDVHAALGRDDEGDAADRAVDQQREVELAVDVGAVLDIEAVDLLAGRAGLLGDQRVAEHLVDVGDHLVDRLGQTNAALGVRAEFLELALAAAAGMDLALHHIERSGQLLRRRLGLAGLEDGDAVGDRRAERLQKCLALVLMDVHVARSPTSWPRFGAMLTQASQSACDRRDRLVEHLLLGPVEVDLDDALDAAGADHHRHADIHVLDAVLARQMRRAGQHALLVLEIGSRPSAIAGGGRRVEGRAGLQQADDLGAAVAGALRRSASSFSLVVQPILTRSGSGMPATVE